MTTTKSPNNANEFTAQPSPGHHLKRRIAHLSRWLHTYLSMFSFAVLLFFAVTGFTLNHADWFDSQRRTSQAEGGLDPAWVKAPNAEANAGSVDKTNVVAFLRRTNGVKGDLGDFNVDDVQCEVSFKGPGYEADAVIDRDTGKYELTVTHFGLAAVLNDLHKGRDTGKRWSEVIDFAAILMTCVSLTGLTLIFFLTKRRSSGLIFIAVGAAICYLIYAVWVP